MSEVTANYAGIHIPGGCNVLVGDSTDSLIDIGVIPMKADSSVNVSYSTVKVQGSKRETVYHAVKDMKAQAKTEIYQIRLNVINELLGGLMTITSSAGAAVSGAVFGIAAGWVLNRLMILPGQNATGLVQTIASVKKGTTALTAGTDYITACDGEGKWGIVMISSANAATSAALTVTYSYTPSAYVKATMGDSVARITPKVVRFRKEQNGKLFQVTLYSAVSTGGLSLSFPGSDTEDPTSVPIELEGGLDTSRASGDQLIEIIDEIGVA